MAKVREYSKNLIQITKKQTKPERNHERGDTKMIFLRAEFQMFAFAREFDEHAVPKISDRLRSLDVEY